jgi:hypothetical protein
VKKWNRVLVAAVLLIVFGAGCYANLTSPMSYRSATRNDAKGLVELGPAEGRACAKSYLGIIRIGDAGYQAAVAQALTALGGLMLYDVRADTYFHNYLGVYAIECTVVHGNALGRVTAPEPAGTSAP